MIKHGLSTHPLYKRWGGMIQRCTNPKNPGYKNYGGRGITVCKEWENSFIAFYNYIIALPEYNISMTIDRIDNDGNYEPGNIRWANSFTQAANKRYPEGRSYPSKNPTHFTLRMTPELKEKTLLQAAKKGQKLSTYIKTLIEKA